MFNQPLIISYKKLTINLFHQNKGFVFLLMSDNLKVNQVCFKIYQKNCGSDKISACNHSILSEVFQSLYATQHIYLKNTKIKVERPLNRTNRDSEMVCSYSFRQTGK